MGKKSRNKRIRKINPFVGDGVFNRDCLKDLTDNLIRLLADDNSNSWTYDWLLKRRSEGCKYNPIRKTIVSPLMEGGSLLE